MDLAKLRDPFPPDEVCWRVGQSGFKQNGEPWIKALAYIDNRSIMHRLDRVCGPANWANEYKAGPLGGVLCGISIFTSNGWIVKWDGAENSDIESVKGGLSDAMKRAAVQWGIGRYLYDIGESFGKPHPDGSHRSEVKEKNGSRKEWVNWNPPLLPQWAVPADGQESLPAAPAEKPASKPAAKGKPATKPAVSTYEAVSAKVIQHAGNYAKLSEMHQWTLTGGGTMSPEEREKLAGAILFAIENCITNFSGSDTSLGAMANWMSGKDCMLDQQTKDHVIAKIVRARKALEGVAPKLVKGFKGGDVEVVGSGDQSGNPF